MSYTAACPYCEELIELRKTLGRYSELKCDYCQKKIIAHFGCLLTQEQWNKTDEKDK